MDINRKLKWAALLSLAVSMGIVLAGGALMRPHLAPYPGRVVDADGRVLFTKADILKGQDVFQRYGLMDLGSVWGHGTQRGPEFSALTLHLAVVSVRERLAFQDHRRGFESLDPLAREVTQLKASREMKANRYDPAADELVLTGPQIHALERVVAHWEDFFEKGQTRYGVLPDMVRFPEERRALARFFFWTAWAASANRPGQGSSYTNNWPPDRGVGNVPSPGVYLWTLGGLLGLLVVLGVFIFMVHHYRIWYGETKGALLADRLVDMPLTPSQRKAAKFFLVVILLFLAQTTFGGLLAHYTVHPASFYRFGFVGKLIPYSWAKSWHLQLAIFWIATAWVASAVYLAPIVGGREPRGQGTLVQLLFVAVVAVAAGSLAGEVAGIKGLLGDAWFWFGHQGWEYLELGRFWQLLLLAGLAFWLAVVYRAVGRHLFGSARGGDYAALVRFYVFSAVLVVGFFGFGLLYGRGSHLSVADYWRWYVVHIWVESIFELFGVGVIALLLVSMGLVSASSALAVGYFTAALAFMSGIAGVAHHYFWFGGPSFWLAIGSVFSSMEPVPLFGMVVRGLMEYKTVRQQGREFPYKWPLYFLVASSFWNFAGAGVFGFLINLPIVNYYEHGTYLTMNHGHTALFGVYGMLSIGLLLFSWRGMVDRSRWDDRLLKVSFFGLNGGLLIMSVLTLFPVGVLQAWTSYEDGLWLARDASFFESRFVTGLGTLRIVPDTVIILLGVVPLAYFLFRTYPHLKAAEIPEGEDVWERLGVRPGGS